MMRKQVYIDDDLDRALKLLAQRTGEPEAEHIRAALRAYLDQHRPGPADDPLDQLVGLVPDPDGPRDVAEHHDRYLYGAASAPLWPRPKVGGYRSTQPLTAEEIDDELAQDFGDSDCR